MSVPDQEEVPPYTSIESNQQLIPMTTYRTETNRENGENDNGATSSKRGQEDENDVSGDENDNVNNELSEEAALQNKLKTQMMVTPQVSGFLISKNLHNWNYCVSFYIFQFEFTYSI